MRDYSADGTLQLVTWFHSGGALLGKFQYSNGAPELLTWFGPDGTLLGTFYYSNGLPDHADYFDDQKRVRRTMLYRADGTAKTSRELDEHGKLVIELPLDATGAPICKTTPQQPVATKDVVGTWYYGGMVPGSTSELTLDPNGQFSLVHRGAGPVFTNGGCWFLTRDARLMLDTLYPITRYGTIEAPGNARVTSWGFVRLSSNSVAPLGGDSSDPRHWAVMSRDTALPLPEAVAPRGEGPPRRGRVAMIAVLTVLLCVSAGLLSWKTLRILRAYIPSRSIRSSAASAILPEIELLRHSPPSGVPIRARPTPAHNWLLATARQVVARLSYFRTRKNPVSHADETPHHHG
ncbi:MAG TPA: hypothetical protein VLT36_16405 [Candidatus Dormibacteraeota bacterium]|nr:hypothetical protein [Candidatus Dormibacteraeota bacterium]